jgi:hypothetical protein
LRSFGTVITPHSRSINRAISTAALGQERNSAPPTPTTATKVSRRVFQGEALLLALLGMGIQSGEAQAIGFKKELKKKKIPIEDYSELGKIKITNTPPGREILFSLLFSI